MSKIERYAKEKQLKEIEPRSRKYTIFLVVFMGLISQMDQYLSLVETVAVDGIIKEFPITDSQFAFWQGIFGFITLSVFFLSFFADRYGRKKGILVLILLMGVPTFFVIFFSTNFFIFMLFYTIIITGTLSNMWELPIVEESKPEKRGTYGGIAYLIGLIPLYAILGPIIMDALGWRWTYGIMFFFMILVLIIWKRMQETKIWTRTHEEHEEELLKFKDALKSLKRKDLQYVAISTVVYTIWTISFKIGVTWVGYYFLTILGIDPLTFRLYLLMASLMTIIGALSAGLLLDKAGRNFTLAFGCIGAAIGYIFLGIVGSPIFMWMIYLFMPIILTWIMIYFSEIFPTRVRSTATGISVTGSRFGYVFGPLIASLLITIFPDYSGLWITAGIFMLIPLLSLSIKPYETKGQSLDEIQAQRE
ncbi:MAG: MFS transporter [Promethearchaeota archaeon]